MHYGFPAARRQPNQGGRAPLAGLLAITLVFATALGGVVSGNVAGVHATPRSATPHTNRDVHHDVSAPLRTIAGKPSPANATPRTRPELPGRTLRSGTPNNISTNVQTQNAATPNMPNTSVNIEGIGAGFTGPQGTFTVQYAPPDPNGVVGLHDFVETVNVDFAVFNKDPNVGTVGTVRYGPVAINTLWSGFGGLCQSDNDGDPTVVYDQVADRWVISQFAVTGANGTTTPFLECVAISTTGDPTGSYNRYAFSYSNFPDYPKMSMWPDAYYETYNLFNAAGTTYLGVEACALDRSAMLTGAATTQVCFTTGSSDFSILPSNVDGSTMPPSGAPNYMLELDTLSSLAQYKFHVDFVTPTNSTFTGPTSISVGSFVPTCNSFSRNTCVPQSGTTNLLESLADRLMYRLAYRNFGSYESLVVDHSVEAGSGAGMRWYEIRSPGTTPTVYQSGTYAPDSSYRFMGSVAQDSQGNMAMGYSVSSSTLNPQIHYTGRLVGDPANTMPQGEASIINGTGSQTGTLHRWGDYSAMTVDPANDCTFWYINEYLAANGTFNWHTRIGAFAFPNCLSDFSISASPASLPVAQGTSGVATISSAVTAGSAGTVNLSASVLPAGPTVSINPASVTAGGTAQLSVSVASGVTPGSYTATVTGVEGSKTHSTHLTIVVSAANQPSTSWYFAEGYTGSSFSTFLTLENATSSVAHVGVKYLLDVGSPVLRSYNVAAHSRSTVQVNNEVGPNVGVSMVVTSDQPIVAERPIYFTFHGTVPGGTDVLGATSLSTQFDFGYLDTTANHDTYLTILNQNASTLTATVQYFPAAGGAPIVRSHPVAATSRGTVVVSNEGLPAGSYSALVTLSQPGLVERPMYLIDGTTGYTGSADVVGVPTPRTSWLFAEGFFTAGYISAFDANFSERYILSNPTTATGTINATVTFYRTDGSTASTIVALAPGQQQVVNAGTVLGGTSASNSASVTATGPILAERFMSFYKQGIPGATDVLGAAAAAHLFYFSEGYTGPGFLEYLTIENPDATQTATVQVTYLPSDGSAPHVETYVVPAHSRFTKFVNDAVPGQSVSMVVQSDIAVVAERPMYFRFGSANQTGGSDVVGYVP